MHDDARTREVRALTDLALTEVGVAVGGVHSTHRSISDRVFRGVRAVTGRAVEPIKTVHDAITDGVYTVIRTGADTAAAVGGSVADLPLASPPSHTKAGATVIAAVTGLIGDDLAERRSVLAEGGVTFRVDGAPVAFGRDEVAAAYPEATGKLIVFVHGLMETEHAFALGEGPHYGPLFAELGHTPVYVRYNSGRHISVNGRALDLALDRLVRDWPVPVDQVVLVGHSMGGLVARSAVHHADLAGRSWVRAVTATASLGTPHLGAPLESLAHYASAALATFRETSAFGTLLRRRSAGIRDLRGGSIVDADWEGRDRDELGAAIAEEVPLLPGADHYFVSACVARSGRNPIGWIVGDGLVLRPSASGVNRARRIGFDRANGVHLPRAHHFSLLAHEDVAIALIDWVG
ncbi:permease [Gordonia spumicola]|uniref:Permease n=1 Tax=Gordonia spumicola TaxID=589161 RepID=A0A7I9VBH2_9ACTN|nr:permease [Gordonia spumicola]